MDHTYAFSFDDSNWDLKKAMEEKLEVKEEMLKIWRQTLDSSNKKLKNIKDELLVCEKFKDDNPAIMFYTGFPNYDDLIAFHDYLKDKVGKLQYWGNSDKPESIPYQEEGKKKPGH